MDNKIIKGIIVDHHYETKYDNHGNEYKAYWLVVEKQKYIAKLPPGIYLQNGMTVLLELDANSPSTVLTGYCTKEGDQWGANISRLKKQLSIHDKYEFVEGTVVEKRKSSAKSVDFNKEHLDPSGSFTIVLKDRNFKTSWHQGKNIMPEKEIAVVLEKNEAVLIYDKETKKLIGNSQSYFSFFVIILVVFNAIMAYVYLAGKSHLINFKASTIVLNVFFVLGLILSLLSLIERRKAMSFLHKNLKS